MKIEMKHIDPDEKSFYLTTDRFNFIISRGIIIDKRGVPSYIRPSYFHVLSTALNFVLQQQMLECDNTTLLELQTTFQSHKKYLQEIFTPDVIEEVTNDR